MSYQPFSTASSLTHASWQFEETSLPEDELTRRAQYLAQRYEMPPVIAQFLASRGLHADNIDVFLDPRLRDLLPNPSSFQDMDKACALLAEAIIAKKPIGIFGDYDVDGACSAALFQRFFNAFGIEAFIHIPDRFTEGYGPNIQALEKLKEAGAELIVTVDCGITAHRPLEDAEAAGMKVIVIDHHQAGPDLPKALAVVNPNRLDDTSGQGALCAAAMVFMACVGTMRHLREAGHITTAPIDLLTLLDLVGMATICDIVPLTPINRAFVKQGLKILQNRTNVGLRHLADQARLNSTPTAYSFGFLLGPRINAGGRIGDSSLGAKLLATHDDAIATSIALQLDDLNTQRRDIEAKVQAAALLQADEILLSQPDTKVLVLAAEGWHEGVLGIVAGRLKDRFHRPTIVISFDETGAGKGSARSIAGFGLGDTIMAAHQSGLIEGGGGHAMAAGLSITQDQISDFTSYMNNAFDKKVGDLPPPSLSISFGVPLSACQMSLVEWLDKCAPFGPSFREPRMLISDVKLSYPRWLGTEKQHLSCQLQDGTGDKVKAIAFSIRDKLDNPEALIESQGAYFNVIGKLKADDYRGNGAVQFVIDDIAASAPGRSVS